MGGFQVVLIGLDGESSSDPMPADIQHDGTEFWIAEPVCFDEVTRHGRLSGVAILNEAGDRIAAGDLDHPCDVVRGSPFELVGLRGAAALLGLA